MSVTIRDIAEELGFSIAAVSRALGGYPDISQETRQRVVQTAQKLNCADYFLIALESGPTISQWVLLLSWLNHDLLGSVVYPDTAVRSVSDSAGAVVGKLIGDHLLFHGGVGHVRKGHPIQAALVLMEGGFRSLTGLERAYGLLYSLAGVLGLFGLCRRAFRRFVVTF